MMRRRTKKRGERAVADLIGSRNLFNGDQNSFIQVEREKSKRSIRSTRASATSGYFNRNGVVCYRKTRLCKINAIAVRFRSRCKKIFFGATSSQQIAKVWVLELQIDYLYVTPEKWRLFVLKNF